MRTMRIVNVIPERMSDETVFDAEPSIAVNPADIDQMAITTQGTPPSDQIGPIFYSFDGGETWELRYQIPLGGHGDESPSFPLTSNELYVGTLPSSMKTLIMEVLRTRDRFERMEVMSSFGRTDVLVATFDQPWAVATTVLGRTDHGEDRLYLGYNQHTGNSSNIRRQAKIDVYLDLPSAEPNPSVFLDDRTPNDSYEIRPAVHRNGTVYVAYKGWISSDGFTRLANVVVARDDQWGAGQPGEPPFTALVDPSDGKPGMVVAPRVHINESLNQGSLGGVRLGNDLAIAVDPADGDVVYLAWGDTQTGPYTLRVRRSTNRGQEWSGDLLCVENATLACLAINDRSTVAFLYQKVVDGRMETHFRTTTDGAHWDDTLMARTLACPPGTFSGDFGRMLAVGPNFYGSFPAMNDPDPANFFPEGGGTWCYQRQTCGGQLIGTDGTTPIAPSVDPFFFKVLED